MCKSTVSICRSETTYYYKIEINITVFETIQFKLFPGMIFGFTFLKPARREPIT
jgi:hypothetical protein